MGVATLAILVVVMTPATHAQDAARPADVLAHAFAPATRMDVGLLALALDLNQMAYGERESLGTNEYVERFIPHHVSAYYLAEKSGKNIHLVVRFNNSDPGLGKGVLEARCRSMIHWVRFHVGLRDNGAPMVGLDDRKSSTLFMYIGDENMDAEKKQAFATELDRQTIVIGDISAVASGARTALCKEDLIPKRP